MPKNKRRYIKKENILKSNDPIEIYKHLLNVLENRGYDCTSEVVPNVKHVDLWVFNYKTNPSFKIANISRDWELKDK
jgi:hypothetical protein